MSVKSKCNHEGSFCPLMSLICAKWTECIEDECEWWCEEKNDSYSGCVLPKLYQTEKAIYFDIRGGYQD